MGVERMKCCGALTSTYRDAGNRQHFETCPSQGEEVNEENKQEERERSPWDGAGCAMMILAVGIAIALIIIASAMADGRIKVG